MTHERHLDDAAAAQGWCHRSSWGADCSSLPYCLRTSEISGLQQNECLPGLKTARCSSSHSEWLNRASTASTERSSHFVMVCWRISSEFRETVHLLPIHVHGKIVDLDPYERGDGWMAKVPAAHRHQLLSLCSIK